MINEKEYYTSVRISKALRKKLNLLKTNLNLKNLDEVLEYLFDLHERKMKRLQEKKKEAVA